VNAELYQLALFLLRAAQAHNVTIPGGNEYNVPPGVSTIDKTLLSQNGAAPIPGLTSYSVVAISGADDFGDSNTKIKDVFDTIVETTRQITPTCESPIIRSYPSDSLIRPHSSRNYLGAWVCASGRHFLMIYSDGSLFSYISYGWPVRSVERLPPYSPAKLKIPVLVIGNTVRTIPRTPR